MMNKASGGDGIPAELFQILKDDAVKVLHSICQQIWKTQQWPQDWKKSVFIPIPKKGNAGECSNYHTIVLTSHISKKCLKSSKLDLNSTHELRTSRCSSWIQKRQRNQRSIANICWIIEKAREFQKNTYFCFIDYIKALTVGITRNCGKFLERWEDQTTLPVFCKTCRQVKKQQLILDMEQQTGSKLGKGVPQGCILSPCLFN